MSIVIVKPDLIRRRPVESFAEFLFLVGRTHREVDIERPGALGEGGISVGRFDADDGSHWIEIVSAGFVQGLLGRGASVDMADAGAQGNDLPLAAAFGMQMFAIKNVATSTPDSRSEYNGQANTQAMLSEGGSNTSVVCPAAHACANLNVNRPIRRL